MNTNSKSRRTRLQNRRIRDSLRAQFEARRKKVNEINQELLKEGISEKEAQALLKERDREVQNLKTHPF